MSKHILFIQGGGDDGYTADKPLVDSLRNALGKEYLIHYPELASDDTQPDFGWIKQLSEQINKQKSDIIVVAHSFGASILVKYLSENDTPKHITAIFLLATPFWDGSEDWQKGFVLKKKFEDQLPKNIPLHFYHNHDDEEVPFTQFEKYKQKIAHAEFHEHKKGGHQFDNDLHAVADDIKSL